MPAAGNGSRRQPESPAPTISDIARLAQVSKATVSRVLNNSPRVAPETRSRVLRAIDSVGFRVNRAARTLRTSRSALVGLLVPAIDHNVFAQIAERLDEDLSDHGVGLLITSSHWDSRRDLRALTALRSRGVDALIVSLADDRNAEVGAYLRSIDRPLVLLDREVRGLACDAVLTEQRDGMREAIGHLAALGHRSVGLITMSLCTRPGREIVGAYRAALAERGLDYVPALVAHCDHLDRSLWRAAVDGLLALGVTAIISMGPMAVIGGVLQRLGEVGRRIPEDISIITYDENELASAKPPRLTVISRPIDEIARRVSRLVTGRLANPSAPPCVEVVGMHLHVRESTGPAGTPVPSGQSPGLSPGLSPQAAHVRSTMRQ